MDYEKELNDNNIGLKTTLKKIIRDINHRIEETEKASEEGEGGSGDCTALQEEVNTLRTELAEAEAKLPSPSILNGLSMDIAQCTFDMRGMARDMNSGAVALITPLSSIDIPNNILGNFSTISEIKDFKLDDTSVTFDTHTTNNALLPLTGGNYITWSNATVDVSKPVKFTIEVYNKQTESLITIEDTFNPTTEEWQGGSSN